ncbi:MAG: hypothetical protein AB7H80_16070 [Candidatus Kapaibacterium sp.]
MGYYLQAIIGKQQTLAQHASDFRHARVVPLAQGLAIIPLTDDLYEEIADDGEVERFEKLSSGVEKWGQRISVVAPVAYIEAEFFGGTGGQSAIVWSGGWRVLEPIHAENAINQVLRFFGIRVDGAHDEFAAVGLGRHRNTDEWIVEATR